MIHLLGAACVALLPGAGCDKETGIVLHVAQGEGFLETPDTLRFLVGVEAEGLEFGAPIPCGSPDEVLQRFIRTPDSSSDVAGVAGRDLAKDPYRLLLTPDADLPIDRSVLVAVGAFAGDQLVGAGALAAPVNFIDGKVLQWDITLVPWAVTLPEGQMLGCVCAADYLGLDAVITPSDDKDCDGAVDQVDCDDNDPWVAPTRPELCGNDIDDNCNDVVDEQVDELCDGADNDCDGLCDEGFDDDGDTYTTCGSLTDKCDGRTDPRNIDCEPFEPTVHPDAPELCDGRDNNCIDGDERFPETTYCYDFANGNGQCWLGTRECRDDAGGWISECEAPADNAYLATSDLCESFTFCAEYADRFQCANDKTFMDAYCELTIIDDPNGARVCPNASEPVPSAGAPDETECTWTLLGHGLDAPFDAYFRVEGARVGSVARSCHAQLVIDQLNAEPRDAELLIWGTVFDQFTQHGRAYIELRRVDAEQECPTDALVCAQQAWP